MKTTINLFQSPFIIRLVVGLIIFCFGTAANAQFAGGQTTNITITSNTDDVLLGNLGDIAGFCRIEGNQVTAINSMTHVEEIGGDLYILNTGLTNLDALSKLEKVGGNLYIKTNGNLIDIEGLDNLKEVGGSLVVQSNYQLEDCCVLQSLVRKIQPKVQGSIIISNNDQSGRCNTRMQIIRCPVAIIRPIIEPSWN